MEAVEVTAKSLEEAKKLAAERLGVEADKVEAVVLEETKGLFGKTTVRVRATAATPAAAPAAAPAAKAARPERKPKATAAAPVEETAPEAVAVAAEAPEEAVAKPARGGRGRSPKAAKEETPSEGEPTFEADAPGASAQSDVVATEQDAENLANLLREIVASAELNVTIKPAGIDGRYVSLELDGKDVAYVVGKHGEVLHALQYLVNIIGNRKLTPGVRVNLDGDNYRKRREKSLTSLATNIADQVKARGEEAVLDALPAFERRIVHKALSTITGIVTYSEGEEPNRRVVIAPAT